jgi:hypothetical protein
MDNILSVYLFRLFKDAVSSWAYVEYTYRKTNEH